MKGGISQPVVIALMVVGFLVASAGGYFLLIRPQHAKAASIDAQIAETNQSIDSARALTLQAKAGAKIRVADIFRLTKAMPDQTDMPDIILQLDQVAQDCGITFDQITPATTAVVLSRLRRDPDHGRVPGQLLRAGRLPLPPGNLVDVRHGGLDANGRLFAIDTIDFAEAPPPPRLPQIRAHLVIDAFVFGTGSVPTVRLRPARPGPPEPAARPERRAPRGSDSRWRRIMAKKIDPKAKAKRQKIFAVVGGVILLGVLAFQVPRTMKLLHQSNATAAATTSSTAASTTPIVTPSPGGASVATGSSTSSADGLTDPNGAVSAQAGQLLALTRFRSKDPFAQQLNLNCGGEAAGNCGGSGGARPESAPARRAARAARLDPVGTGKGTGSGAAAGHEGHDAADLGQRQQRERSGRREVPGLEPDLRPRLADRDPREGRHRGRLDRRGKQTITLKKGVPLTLMNTADGTRYVLGSSRSASPLAAGGRRVERRGQPCERPAAEVLPSRTTTVTISARGRSGSGRRRAVEGRCSESTR